MRLLTSAVLLFSIVTSSAAQQIEITFEVILKDQKIGKVRATETKTGTHITRDVKSESDAKVLAFSVHLETETKVVNGEEILVEGIAYRHASRGPEDIHAKTKRMSTKKYERERNGKKTMFENEDITFCVADLFFKEPVHLQKVYSNMHAEMLPIKSLGKGKYQVTAPDKKITMYTYLNGKLMTIESDTPLGMVISKRI
jgi:hypothetical protein